MEMRRIALAAVALVAATSLQGCAVFYATDTTDSTGSTDRQIGLFGGCLPLWHYRSVKVKPVEDRPKQETQAKETPTAEDSSRQ